MNNILIKTIFVCLMSVQVPQIWANVTTAKYNTILSTYDLADFVDSALNKVNIS